MSSTTASPPLLRDTHFMEIAPRLEIVGDFMRERALATIAAFPWAQTQARTTIDQPE